MKKQKKTVAQPIQPAMVAPQQPKLPFDVWWMLFCSQRKLSPDLKEPVRLHMIARGFWTSQDWTSGIRDFGL